MRLFGEELLKNCCCGEELLLMPVRSPRLFTPHVSREKVLSLFSPPTPTNSREKRSSIGLLAELAPATIYGRPDLLPPASRVTRPDSPPVRLRDPAATPVWRGVASHPSHAPCSEQNRATNFRHGQDAHHDSAYSLRPARHAALLIHICPTLLNVIHHVHHSVPEAVVPWSRSSGH